MSRGRLLEEGIELMQAACMLRDAILQPRYRNEERKWRKEDQEWREEDRDWRQEDRRWRDEDLRFMNNQKQWRLHDLEQRSLENARVLWDRFMEKNRRDVEERAEQLKSIGNMAALIAGFAVVAFLEFSADTNTKALEIMFGLTTALVVGLNTQAMVATSLLHASILRSGKLYVDEAAEAEYMRQCLTFVTEFHVGMAPPAPRRTFAQHWETRCERDWRWAFQLFSLGLVAFICNLMVAAWIKFGQQDLRTPVLVTVTLAVCLIGMGRSIALWAPHLFQRPQVASGGSREDTVVQLGEEYGLPFAWHRVPKPVDDLALHRSEDFQDAPSRFHNTSDAPSSNSTSGVLPVALDGIGSAPPAAHALTSQGTSGQLDAGAPPSRAAGAERGGGADRAQAVLPGSGSSASAPQSGIQSWWCTRNREGYHVVSGRSDSLAPQHPASDRRAVGAGPAHWPTDHDRHSAGRTGDMHPGVAQHGSLHAEIRSQASDGVSSGDAMV